MTVPLFDIQESRTWVRTSTHTVIREQEPDYARFVASGDGHVQRVLRVWLADPLGAHRLRVYLGSVTVANACPRLRDLRRIFRRAEQSASGPACPASVVRAELMRILRHEMLEPVGDAGAG
ncbi:MAG TPA: hypothetical protein VFZ65_14170 [Planctomycetota bacterium]|nr:hypothetical protein [Planctomycetota bacterium]